MSYILDALKKAEAQRTLGALPNIHAPTVLAAPAQGTPLRRRAALWGSLAALAALLAALAWLRPWQPGTPAKTPSVVPAPAALPATAPAPAEPPLRATRPAPQAALPAPAAKPKTAASHAPATPSQPQPKATALAKKPAPPPAAPAGAPEPELQTLAELPPRIQSEIPALVISGYIYSANRAERSLLVNQQLLREGDSVAPGLVLEKMLPGAVVLNYRGYRYRMPY